MKRQMVTVLAAAALGGFVLAAAGCGGGGSTTTQGAPATGNTTTEASGTTTGTTGTAGALGSLLSSKGCRDLANLSAAFSQAFAGTAGADLQKTAALMKQFADQTPADIRPDFEVVAAAYAKIAEALKGIDLTSGKVPSADVIARLQKLSSEIDQAKLTQATQHIQAWAQKNCKAG